MKSRNWVFGAIYTALLDWSIVNSTILMVECNPAFSNAVSKCELLSDLLEIINSLSCICNEPQSVEPMLDHCCKVPNCTIKMPVLDVNLRCDFSVGHFPRRSNKHKICVLHSNRFCRSYFYCSICKVFLHCKNCFELFHTVV